MSSTQVIIPPIAPYTQIVANSGQTVFSTDWTANYATDVVVYYTPLGQAADDATQILEDSEFNVEFIGEDQIVQVTLVTPAVNTGDMVTITRQTPADRENLYSNTNFTPTMLNNDFGILTLVDQQNELVNQLIAPRYNYSAVIQNGIDNILPVLGPSQMWIKNPAGTAIVAVPYNTGGGDSNLFPTDPSQHYISSAKGSFVVGHALVAADTLGTVQDSGFFPAGNVEPGTINDIAFYSTTGSTISPIATADNGVLVTNSSGVPSIQNALPSGLTIPIPFISGIVDGSNAPSGYVEEVFSQSVLATSPVNFSSTIVNDIASVPLTAGDWDVYGNFGFNGGVMNTLLGWLSITSATEPDFSLIAGFGTTTVGNIMASSGLSVPYQRINVTSPTTVYLSAFVTFSSGASTRGGYGNITARRRR